MAQDDKLRLGLELYTEFSRIEDPAARAEFVRGMDTAGKEALKSFRSNRDTYGADLLRKFKSFTTPQERASFVDGLSEAQKGFMRDSRQSGGVSEELQKDPAALNEAHPAISATDRFLIKNLTPMKQYEALKAKYPDLDIKQGKDGIKVKSEGESEYRFFDPPKAEWSDVTDIAGDIVQAPIEGLAAGAGAILGLPGGAPGAAGGAMLGGGLAAGAFDASRQGLANLMGLQEGFDSKQFGMELGIGAGGSLIPGGKTVTSGMLKKASAAPRNIVVEGATKTVPIGSEVVNQRLYPIQDMLGGLPQRILETGSGASPQSMELARNHIKDIMDAKVATQYSLEPAKNLTTKLTGQLTDSFKTLKSVAMREKNDVLSQDVKVDISDIVKNIDDQINEIKGSQVADGRANFKDYSEVAQAKIKKLESIRKEFPTADPGRMSVENYMLGTSPTKKNAYLVSPKKADDIYKGVRAVSDNVSKANQSAVDQEANNVGYAIRQALSSRLDESIPGFRDVNDRYMQLAKTDEAIKGAGVVEDQISKLSREGRLKEGPLARSKELSTAMDKASKYNNSLLKNLEEVDNEIVTSIAKGPTKEGAETLEKLKEIRSKGPLKDNAERLMAYRRWVDNSDTLNAEFNTAGNRGLMSRLVAGGVGSAIGFGGGVSSNSDSGGLFGSSALGGLTGALAAQAAFSPKGVMRGILLEQAGKKALQSMPARAMQSVQAPRSAWDYIQSENQ